MSRPLSVAEVPPDGIEVEVVADAAERAALAKVNEVISVERLVARLLVRPFGAEGLMVRGALEAETTRSCVVSLEPFVEQVHEPVELRFSPDAPEEPDLSDDRAPEPLVGGAIDLGAIAAEFFTLGLAPHPRKPGATFASEAAEAERRAAESPFAVLRRRLDGGE